VKRVLSWLLCGSIVACGPSSSSDQLVVAAAADLRPVFEEGGAPDGVVFQFGSSGQLAQQIVEGAPVDVFLSADAGYVDLVISRGRGDPSSRRVYALGRLVVWSREQGRWSSLAEVVTDPDVRVVAIANPEHAPYGAAARAALEAIGAWEMLADRLVYGENVSDTLRLASSGDADVALVSASLALAAGGYWIEVDERLYPPLEQTLVVVTEDPDRRLVADRFVSFLTGEKGRALLERFGFGLP
jgi:molybdate transport system substrate-binding protein